MNHSSAQPGELVPVTAPRAGGSGVSTAGQSGVNRHRRGRIPVWLPLTVLLVGVVSLLHRLDKKAQSQGVAMVDVTRYRLHSGDRWVSEAWTQALERILVRAGSLEADDRDGIDRLRREIGTLSFVAEVGDVEVDWPDGLLVPLRLRRPVACIQVGDDYLPVADDGTVLSGYSYTPHRDAAGSFPVLGPQDLDLDPLVPFEAGDILSHPAHLDALAVAISMRTHLASEDLRRLGRVVVDASRAQAYDGFPGGVVIDLEGARRVHFGRPPAGGGAGELPVSNKWAHVSDGLARWEAGENFDALDVRWDEAKSLYFDEGR